MSPFLRALIICTQGGRERVSQGGMEGWREEGREGGMEGKMYRGSEAVSMGESKEWRQLSQPYIYIHVYIYYILKVSEPKVRLSV